MGDKITEEQVANLAAIVRTDASVDAKVHQFNTIKSGIKQTNVPDAAVPLLFEATRTAMSTPHAALTNAGFSTLNHLLTRMSRQEPKHIAKEAARTLPLVIEKMGDHKDKYRQLAAQCLTTFWKNAPIDAERIVKNTGLVGKNSRMKEASMQWIVQMHTEYQMPFKSYVSTLMELLEDADGMVRDVARNSVIELFENAPNAAKSDLKKQLKIYNVRQTIASAIIAHLGPAGPAEAEPEVIEAPRPKLASSMTSLSAVRPATPEVKIEYVEPSYVNTRGELEDIFRDMQPFFEGKESEGNWLKREQSCTKIRRLIAGNVLDDFRDAFLGGIKGMLDGILKAVNSLRTSLSKEGCSVIQELARSAGPGIDNMVEILLQNLVKLCGGTKKISSQNGNLTVDIIVGRVSYNIRIMQHIYAAAQDKNVQPRTYATGWLKTLLKKEAHHKNHLEHTGGLDLVEKCIKKGLADANPGVRENMRSTYWAFAQIWPAKAETIFAGLDNTQQRLLENAPDNPNSPKKPEAAASARPGLGLSKSTMGPPKPSLRETMLAQKKAAMAASKNLPARPGSAMSSFSPMRTVSSASHASTASTGSDAPVRARPEPAAVSHKGLSVAPMRPTKFKARPEIARPATAGPYSVRRPGHAPTNSDTISPSAARSLKARTPSASSTSPPKRTLPSRPNTSHSSHASQSSHNSPIKSTVSKVAPSPRPSPRSSPAKSKSMANLQVTSSPLREEDFTMVVPKVSKLREMVTEPLPTLDSSDDEPSTPAKSMKIYEDPFSGPGDQTTPRPTFSTPVLGEVAVNEDAAKLRQNGITLESNTAPDMTPEQYKQSSRLLDSGINKIKAKSLDLHGFRKLQSMIRDNKAGWNNEKFDMLLMGLFAYLEAPLPLLTPDKAKDVKAQVLKTIELMYKKDRDAFHGYAPTGLTSIIAARSSYDARDHIVSAMEQLAKELVTLADPKETSNNIVSNLQSTAFSIEGCRALSMGLYVLKQLIQAKSNYSPSVAEASGMGRLAARCLDSSDSGVRMDAVQLCVSLHGRVGEMNFWGSLDGLKDTSRNLITYYVAKEQNEARDASTA